MSCLASAGGSGRTSSTTCVAGIRRIGLKALAGHQTTERRPDRSYWSLGGELRWRRLIFEAKYQDTDLSRRECGFNPNICSASLTAAVTAVLPLILFPQRAQR